MADLTQKLTMIAELLGDKEVLASLQKLSSAQQGVAGAAAAQAPAATAAGEAVAALGEAAGAAAGAQEEHTLTLTDFARVLQIIDPRLGAMATRLTRAAMAFGDLGTKAIDFTAIGAGLVNVVTKFGSSLALLGAGGAAVAGISFLVSQITKVREEAEKAREGIERMTKAQTDLERGRMDAAAKIIADRDKLRGAPSFDSRQGLAVKETLGRLPAEVQEDAGGLLKMLGGASELEGGGQFGAAELETLLRQGFKSKSERPATVARQARRFLARPETAEDLKTIRERIEAEREAERSQGAFEARTFDPTVGLANLKKIVEEKALGTGADVDKVTAEVRRQLRRREQVRVDPAYWGSFPGQMPRVTQGEMGRRAPRVTGLSTDDIDAITKDFATPEAQAIIESLKAIRAARQPVSISIHNESNSKKIVPGAAYQERARVNGESTARDAERFP